MNKIFDLLMWPFRKFKERQEYRRKLAELRKRDPFIYK
jgi:hypothetical protein